MCLALSMPRSSTRILRAPTGSRSASRRVRRRSRRSCASCLAGKLNAAQFRTSARMPPGGVSAEPEDESRSARLFSGCARLPRTRGPIQSVTEHEYKAHVEQAQIPQLPRRPKQQEHREIDRCQALKQCFAGAHPADCVQRSLAHLREVSKILDAKAPDAAAFKTWLRSIGQSVAEAASEGSFLGFGGVRVTTPRKRLSTILPRP